ncbi:phage integrase [Escherichia coli]|uniref:Phage integrase n=1 Tax=Escherichia coli TaxID=562 RepID=A0A377DN52_ECOLX|nr:phage integrase [Escherichia coli]
MLKQHLDPIEKRGVLETLRRVISRLNEIFRYAATEELIEFNPADNLGQRFQQAKKNRICQHYPLPNSPASWLL